MVGEAAHGREALAIAAAHRPDVVVLDLAMPVMDGATALRAWCETGPRVLVLTLSEEDATVLGRRPGRRLRLPRQGRRQPTG